MEITILIILYILSLNKNPQEKTTHPIFQEPQQCKVLNHQPLGTIKMNLIGGSTWREYTPIEENLRNIQRRTEADERYKSKAMKEMLDRKVKEIKGI